MLEKVCGLVAATAEHSFWLLECTQHCFGGQGGWPNILSAIVYEVVYGIVTKKAVYQQISIPTAYSMQGISVVCIFLAFHTLLPPANSFLQCLD